MQRNNLLNDSFTHSDSRQGVSTQYGRRKFVSMNYWESPVKHLQGRVTRDNADVTNKYRALFGKLGIPDHDEEIPDLDC